MSNPLDLGDSTPQQSVSPQTANTSSGRHDLRLRGVPAGQSTQLSQLEPVVELSREQSATGTLTMRAAIPDPNDLILVAAYELADGREGIVVPSLRPAGPDATSPLLRAAYDITLDLRGLAQLHRMFVAGLPRGSNLRMPGGTLTVTTADRARLDVPIGDEVTLGAKALLTAYVVEGQLVIRAEHDRFSGTLQQVCGAYGYTGLSWKDAFTPL